MSIRYTKLLFAGLLALFTIPSLAVCPEMEVWSDGTNYRYFMADCHLDYIDGRVSLKQQTDILWAAQQKKAEGVFVIAEDSCTYSGTNKKIQQFYKNFGTESLKEQIAARQIQQKINDKKAQGSLELLKESGSYMGYNVMSPLMHLISECQKLSILNYNIECKGAIAIYQVDDLPASEAISKQEVIDDLFETIAEISDCKELYEEYVSSMKDLQVRARAATHMDKKEFIKCAKIIREYLVDLGAIRKLIQWKQYKHGLVFAGQFHLKKIKQGLAKLGYKKISAIGEGQINKTFKDIQENDIEPKEAFQALLTKALDLKQTFQQIFIEQSPEIIKLQNQMSTFNALIAQADAQIAQLLSQNKENTAQCKEQRALIEQYQKQIEASKKQMQAAKIEHDKKAAEEKAIQNKANTPSIISSIINYKWPIAVGATVIGAVVAWFYWKK